METLFIKGLSLVVNSSTDIWHARVTGRHRNTFPWTRGSRFGLCLRGVAVPFTVFCSRWALCQVIIP